MYRLENIQRRISELQRMLATADDQLEIALLKMAIESFEAERASLQVNDRRDPQADIAHPNN